MGNILFQCCRNRGRHRQPKLSLQRTRLSSSGLFSTCSLFHSSKRWCKYTHCMVSSCVFAFSGCRQQNRTANKMEMPLEQGNTDPPGHRLLCIAGAELLQPQRHAPNLLVQYRQTRHQNYAGSAHFHFHR